MNSSKSSVYFVSITHSDTGCSSEIFELDLDFRSTAIEKVDSHFQVVPDIFKSFPVTQASGVYFYLIKIK